MKFLLAAACVFTVFFNGVSASAAPLRVLVYRYSHNGSGFGQSASMGGGVVSENGEFGTEGREGQITAAVESATPDGGLVVDLTQTIDRKLRPLETIRCAVYGKTLDVICDQHLNATPEETVLVSYLGRFFYDSAALDAKKHWQAVPKFRPALETITNDFTVISTDGPVVTLAIDKELKGNGIRATTTGTMTYDTAMEIPRSVHVDTRTEGSSTFGDSIVNLTLVSDSMAPGSDQKSH